MNAVISNEANNFKSAQQNPAALLAPQNFRIDLLLTDKIQAR